MANSLLGTTDRYRAASLAEQYALGRQYDNLDEWTNKSVPLRQRRPLVQIPLFAEAITALDRFIWGGARFPRAAIGATRKKDEPEAADEIGPRLFPDQAARLTSFLSGLGRVARLQNAIREASRGALVTTSHAMILGACGGYLQVHCEPGKNCTRKPSRTNPRDTDELVIQYKYMKEELQDDGSYRKREYWYRRVVDDKADTTYKEIPVTAYAAPKWAVDPDKTIEHNLGWCPVVWLRTLPDSSDLVDGRPVIDPQMYPMIDDVNYVASQRSRAVSYGCDPQPVRKGLSKAEREELQKSPNKIWDLENPSAEIKLLEANGTGAQRASEHINDMVMRFREAVGVVKADPKATAGKISGVVLEFLHQPMVALASDLRVDLGDNGYCHLLNMALRMVATLAARGEKVWVSGSAEAADLINQSQLAGPWLDYPITLEWPQFFQLTTDDRLQLVEQTNRAVKGGLITHLTGTRYVAQVFAVEDPEAEQEDIVDEAAELAALTDGDNVDGAASNGAKPLDSSELRRDQYSPERTGADDSDLEGIRGEQIG